jgi:asparagine synthase (glutamine-hydrolysing)
VCGIAGILIAPNAADPRRLDAITAMTASLRHRGPDSDGFWINRDASVALGHRRLAIVDLSSAGHQPMISHGAALVVTYNGEIYNFAELRQELESRGHCFVGHSDTEVMLTAFESLGIEAALSRFAGMFAIGLWDRHDRVLHLIRDRLGKKPLHVTLIDGALVFASELKAFRSFPGFRPQLDPAALTLMLRQGWIPEQHCIWQGVFKLPPGGILSVRPEELHGATPDWLRNRVRIWWSLADQAERGQQYPDRRDLLELESELDQLLRTAVRERMVADVPVGVLLSGGIDSSLVVALMQAQSSAPIHSFTVGFSEPEYSESDDAYGVAEHLGTKHTELLLTAEEARNTIPELPRIWDEPFGCESQLPTLLVSRLARRHVTVALTGDGGDESFGGYARHFHATRLAPLWRVPPRLRRLAASPLRALSADALDQLLRRLPLPARFRRALTREQLQKLISVLDAADDRQFYRRLVAVSEESALLKPAPDDALAEDIVPPLPDTVNRLMYRDMAGYLPGDCLVKLDRASMAVSLEGRCPLLDHRVVEFAWHLPVAVKTRNGSGKWLLRRLLRRYLPEELFDRPKHGFNVPLGAWLRGPLRDWAEALIAPSRLRSQGLLDPARVQRKWRDHISGQRDRAAELWAILMFQAWHDVANELPTAQPAALRDEVASAPGRYAWASGGRSGA